MSLTVCGFDAGLGQHRLMPPGDYAQEKALKQEEKLIGQLERLELTSDLIKVLRDQVLWLLDGNCLRLYFGWNARLRSSKLAVLLAHFCGLIRLVLADAYCLSTTVLSSVSLSLF